MGTAAGQASSGQYAEIAVDIAAGQTDRPFHYLVPEEFRGRLRVGQRVRVPFGPRRLEGFVLGFPDSPDVEKLRPIEAILDEEAAFEEEQIELARWMSRHYLCSLVQALRVMLPPGVRGDRLRPKTRELLQPASRPHETLLQEVAGAPRQAEVLRYLLEEGPASRAHLKEVLGVSGGVLQALVERDVVQVVTEETRRRPVTGRAGGSELPELTDRQQEVLDAVEEALKEKRHEVFLLRGVTGSGKTEIYLRAIQHGKGQGGQAIVLVPEIALTPQMVTLFRDRFGEEVAVLHSALSQGERYDEWRRIRRQEVSVVVGARSAVFAPLRQLRLIVIDEEHETTYKQEEEPRYHARQVAIERARRLGAVVILGSATPAVESYLAAEEGHYRLLELPERIGGRPLAAVQVVDMRDELKEGNKSIFSRQLREQVAERLAQKEQVVLFLNRRGFHTFVLCRECGRVLECPECQVTLTYHHRERSLRCHYCGYGEPVPDTCPSCGSPYIRFFGTGTERVERLARREFPEARLLRMDVDTTRRKGAHAAIYQAFRRGEADILIGTQMVAKGWDVPGVTLVGVMAADTALHLPDYRSGERTFQLLTQVAGRAGRGEAPGQVVIQTYSPEHYAVRLATSQDYAEFAREELRLRRQGGYPPYARLARLLVQDTDARRTEELIRRLARVVETVTGVEAWPPVPAPIERLRGLYRWHQLLRAPQRSRLEAVAGQVKKEWREMKPRESRLTIDIDPGSLL